MSSSTVIARLKELTRALGASEPDEQTERAYVASLGRAIRAGADTDDTPTDASTGTHTERLWLALAAISATLPLADEFEVFRRDATLNGIHGALERRIRASRGVRAANRNAEIRIETGRVVVDVHHTSRTGLATGIQRVVRQTILEWQGKPNVELVGWNQGYTALRALSGPEQQNALHGSQPHLPRPKTPVVTIPYRSTYLLPELAIEEERTARISALAQFSGNRTGVIGFDCVPLTSAETVGAGMSAAFAKNLAALAHFDRISTISAAAATEYRGWRQMLSGAGLTGPQIEPLLLPSVAEEVSAADFTRAKGELLVGTDPLVVVVGSHEPRKNHLAVLYAAERLWLEGVAFQLVFIGGNGWHGDEFRDRLDELRGQGRPVRAISAISDSLLWSAYRLARISVFPSLNEGFGLPVGESLSAGTPVVTSNFGSMKEIAAFGGAILVDPRDDDDIYRGMRAGLLDDELHARLVGETALLPDRGWGEYASELWDYFA